MSAERDVDRIVRSWIREDDHESADPILGIVLSRLDSTPQRRSWRPAWRHFDMTNLRALTAVATAVVIVGAAIVILPNLGVGRGPVPTSTPTTIPTPAGPSLLEAGTHTTSQFQPQLTYTVPVGWALLRDEPQEWAIAPSAFESASLVVCRNPQPGDARAQPVAIDGSDAEAMSTWLGERSELGITNGPTALTMGGLDGYWFDLRAPSDGVEVNVVGHVGDEGCGINLHPDQRMRLAFLDGPDATLLVFIWDAIGSETFIEGATTITESFSFAAP